MLREMDLEIRVRYQETDAMGVLHHANYITYFEIGRTELLRSTGISYKDLEDQGILMVIVKIGVRYRRPANYDDGLTWQTRPTRAGGFFMTGGPWTRLVAPPSGRPSGFAERVTCRARS